MARFDDYLDWLVANAQTIGGQSKPPAASSAPHPGTILQQDYLLDRGLSQSELARRVGCSHAKVNEVINGHRGVTPRFALDLERVLGTPAAMWLSLQLEFDLQAERRKARTSRM
jgi:addiction module HigA family antidote